MKLHSFVFLSSSPHQSQSQEVSKWRKGAMMRQFCLAFTSHNDSQLNSHINCWSPVWMVPLVVVLHTNTKDPVGTFSSCPWLQSYMLLEVKVESLPCPPLDVVYQTCHQVKEHLNYVVPTVQSTKHFSSTKVFSGQGDPFVFIIFLMRYTPQCIST